MQQNKIDDHFKDPRTYWGHHQFEGPSTIKNVKVEEQFL